jgi:hypothetical protein
VRDKLTLFIQGEIGYQSCGNFPQRAVFLVSFPQHVHRQRVVAAV